MPQCQCQCFSKCHPGTSSIKFPGNFLEMHVLGSHSKTSDSKALGWGPGICIWMNPPLILTNTKVWECSVLFRFLQLHTCYRVNTHHPVPHLCLFCSSQIILSSDTDSFPLTNLSLRKAKKKKNPLKEEPDTLHCGLISEVLLSRPWIIMSKNWRANQHSNYFYCISWSCWNHPFLISWDKRRDGSLWN